MKKRLISMLMAVLMIASLLLLPLSLRRRRRHRILMSISIPPLASRKTLRRKLPA